MTDTIRSLTTLQSNLADNTSRSITPQKLRDAVYSTLGVVPYVSKSATYAPTENDYFIAVDASGGAVTLNLPACASLRVGKTYIIKKVDSSGNAVSVNPNSAETLDGSSTTLDITTQWYALTIVNTGSAWLAVSEYTP